MTASPRSSRSASRSRRSRPSGRIGLAVAALVAAALALTACGSDHVVPGITKTVTKSASSTTSSSGSQVALGQSSATTSAAPSKTKVMPPKPKGAPVKVISSIIGDGNTVGVGLPIILLLNKKIKDAKAFAKATKVTVNGKPATGGWFFEYRYEDGSYPVEADWRMQNYWPAHAQIHLSLPVKGLSAGTGLVFADSLTLDFSTGPANILTASSATHTLTYYKDDKLVGKYPISLGYPNTPTKRGIKVIMEKGASIPMSGPGYYDPAVKLTQRLTYDGEYLHSAPWNCTGTAGCTSGHGQIGISNTSNGCTNLTPTNAATLYSDLHIGDVVKYPDADGPLMQLGDGYGDWNVQWGQWLTGGLYSV